MHKYIHFNPINDKFLLFLSKINKQIFMMKSDKKIYYRHVPNAITCMNLFCGCLSVIASFDNLFMISACCIIVAAVFDFLDGFAARWLQSYSAMGKELDSLADMVSFGVAPGFIMYQLILQAEGNTGLYRWLAFLAILIPVFAALRLAKFNTDTRQTDSFIGLPKPASALFICSLAFIASYGGTMSIITTNICFLLTTTFALSLLMVAELPLFSLKFKTFNWKNNKTRYWFVIISALVLATMQGAGLAAVIMLYILFSIISNILCKRKVSS